MATNHTDRSTEPNDTLASTNAYLAVGLLSDAIGPDKFYRRDIDEAIDHLKDGLNAAVPGSESAVRIDAALGYLADLDDMPTVGERKLQVREALAELAPVAAGVAGVDPQAKRPDDKPSVPVFYQVPPAAANRAIEKFKRRRQRIEDGETGQYLDQRARLSEYIFDEIHQETVIWVGGETLAEYASQAGVESLVIDPAEDTDG